MGLIHTIRPRLLQCRERKLEADIQEAHLRQLLPDAFTQLLRALFTGLRELCTACPKHGLCLRHRLLTACSCRIIVLELGEALLLRREGLLHLRDGSAILHHDRADIVEALRNLLEVLLVVLVVLHIVVERAHGILGDRGEVIQAVADVLKRAVVLEGILHLVDRRRKIDAVEDLPRPCDRTVDALCILVLPVLLGERFLLTFTQFCLFDIVDLELQEIELPLALPLVHVEARELLPEGRPVMVLFCDLRTQCPGLPLLEIVKDLQMVAVPEQRLVLMLPVDVDEELRHLPELCERHGLIIDLDFRTRSRDLPADDELPVLRLDLECPQLPDEFLTEIAEDELHESIRLAAADHVPAGLRAQREIDGADQDGLTGTRFTGQNIEPGLELHLRGVDQGEILYMKMI